MKAIKMPVTADGQDPPVRSPMDRCLWQLGVIARGRDGAGHRDTMDPEAPRDLRDGLPCLRRPGHVVAALFQVCHTGGFSLAVQALVYLQGYLYASRQSVPPLVPWPFLRGQTPALTILPARDKLK
jgi:hypothetical protein